MSTIVTTLRLAPGQSEPAPSAPAPPMLAARLSPILAGALGLAVALAFAAGHAGLLRLLVPGLSFLLAAALFRADRRRYLQFVFLVWFALPLLRRLVDYQAGWVDPSPLLLTPYLVTLAGPLLFTGHIVRLPLRRYLPFLLGLFAVALGLVCGIAQNPLTAVVMGLVNWLSPLALGALILLDEEHHAHYLRALPPVLPLLLATTALYTLLQFVLLFPWDAAWLLNLNLPSMGIAEPFAFRAFGNLNSAGACAFALATCALTLFDETSSLRIPAIVLSAGALLVTQVRAGWVVFTLGAVLLLAKSFRRTASTLLVAGAVLAVLLGAGVGAGAASQAVGDRLASITHPSEDTSAGSRTAGYEVALDDIAQHPLGHGLGVPEDVFDIQGSFSLRDSGPIDLLVTFGWLGGFAYGTALLLLLGTLCRRLLGHAAPHTVRYGIPALALLAAFPLSSIGVTVPGLLLWTFLALALIQPLADERGANAQAHESSGEVAW